MTYLNGPSGSSYLGGPSDPPRSVLNSDYISLRSGGASEAYGDIDYFQDHADYRDRVYGRAVYDDGKWWLQYWMFYYYNPWDILGVDVSHEGDWEMIQVALNQYGLPLGATYFQHDDGGQDACTFSSLHYSLGAYANISPRVYVAEGSHASYARPGTFEYGQDSADGNGDVAYPVVRMMDPDESSWVKWPGKWGDSGSSPASPIRQSQRWNSPADFDDDADACDFGSSPLARAQGYVDGGVKRELRRVDVLSERDGHSVRVRFSGDFDLGEVAGAKVFLRGQGKGMWPGTRVWFRRDGREALLPLPERGTVELVKIRLMNERGQLLEERSERFDDTER